MSRLAFSQNAFTDLVGALSFLRNPYLGKGHNSASRQEPVQHPHVSALQTLGGLAQRDRSESLKILRKSRGECAGLLATARAAGRALSGVNVVNVVNV